MNKKHIAMNTHLLFFVIFFLVILGMFEVFIREKEIGLSIGFGIFLLLPILAFLISPLYFIFSDECLEIVYHFGQREQIKWNEIKSISSRGSWISKGGGFPRYEIIYSTKEKRPFFVVGEVSKTGKTKKMIKKYYKKGIM